MTTAVPRRVEARHARAGFTLIEVVIALVIFAMITLMVYSAFFIGHRAVLKGERQADINQRMRLAEDVIGRQLRSTVFYFAMHEDEKFPYFVGRMDELSFVTAAPQSRGGTGLAVVTYRIVGNRLLMEERVAFTRDDLYDPPREAPIERAVLFTDFRTMRFEYLPHDDSDTAWQSNWDARDEETIPAAVRLSVDGLEFFGGTWVREIPLMTIAYGWGNDDFQEPPDDEDEQTGGGGIGDNDNIDNEGDDD